MKTKKETEFPVSGKRPNILFLMCDQHRHDFMGCAGHVARTPNLDRLAAEGARFSNCYTPSPVCVPGRQAMMAGQFPRHCNCMEFHSDLEPNYMTFARRFSQYAYSAVCCGKLHHTGTDQMQGWTSRIGEETHVAARCIEGRVEEEFARYKAEPSNFTILQDTIRRAGIGENPIQLVDEYTALGAMNFVKLHFANGWKDPAKVQAPLLMKVSLLAPHDPFVTNDYDRFAYYLNRVRPFPDEAPLPEMVSGKRDWPEIVKPGHDVSYADIVRCHAAYCAMIERADEIFGEVMRELENAGQNLDDWMIVYTSDHGELLGEHNCWFKFKFYEGCAKVPLIIRAPKAFAGGKTISENVNLCDLFATLCDFAQIPAPEGLDSRSLMPLLRGDASAWNNESISQIANHLMIKQDSLKYIKRGDNGMEILFDLEKNPGETANFAGEPEYAGKIAGFRRRAKELGYL